MPGSIKDKIDLVNNLLVDAVAVLFLSFDELVHDVIQRVGKVLEIAMEIESHGQNGECCIVDEGGAQVRQGTGRMLTRIFVQVPRNQVVCGMDGQYQAVINDKEDALTLRAIKDIPRTASPRNSRR